MLFRVLLLALASASTLGLTPLAAPNEDNDCALYLAGPGRTSAYDYSLNLLRGNFGYEGQHTCITYDAINQAYLDARKRILVSQPKGDWKPEDYASVGELILDISINLARTYGLTYEEIEKGLPLIDTSQTLIRDVCPPVFSHVECRAGKYRRLDGLCNNLQHPTWGSTNVPFQRLIGPLFADGINAPRIAHSGRDLPGSRVVSRTMHPDEGFHDHAGTVMVIAWGQFMDHDFTLTATPLDPRNRNDPEECCKRPQHLKHPYCNEIRIPDDDYFYKLFGVTCIDFVRGFPSPRPGCRLGSRVPFNTLTGVIDGNTVYGVTDKFARKLRTGYGGLLRMNPVFEEYGLKDLLPLKLDIPDEGCTRPNKNMYCFEAGEIRVNEQLVLTVMHTLMAREHNRVAKGLAAVNAHWDDETLYQEARRINIAEIQHITYNEFLPILLGKDVMEKFGLVLEKEGYWDGYDAAVNPDVIDSFASAAYRFGHSLLPTAVERWSKAHKFIASKRLSDLIRRPYDLYRAGVLDEYVMGLMNQVAQAMDDSITQEVTNHLFKKVGARFGMDLVSFNMQRGREFGIPGYMEFRKFCGLPGADDFQGLFGSMPNETVRKYESIFEHPIDVDLWSGGVSERPLPGSMLGPTFACVIATQFSYARRGDRFWFELPNQPSSFTPEQVKEIRKSRLARVICDNTDIIDTTQLYPMVLPDHELNPRVPCRSGIIPSMDFSKWAEPAPFRGPAKQFITDALFEAKNITDLCDDTTLLNQPNETTISNVATNAKSQDIETNLSTVIDVPVNCTEDIGSTDAENNLVQITASNCTLDSNVCNENNEGIKSDTVLKYVYKKNENQTSLKKSTGHTKNSLHRKRRSLLESKGYREQLKNAPLIVNYETSHPSKRKQFSSSLSLNNDHPVKSSDVADFSIETLNKKPIQKAKHDYNAPISDESHEEYSHERSKEKLRNSQERLDNRDDSGSDELPYENSREGLSDSREKVKDYKESEERNSRRNNEYKKTDKIDEPQSRESYEDEKRSGGSGSDESNEKDYVNKGTPKEKQSIYPKHDEENSESNENYREPKLPLHPRQSDERFDKYSDKKQDQNGRHEISPPYEQSEEKYDSNNEKDNYRESRKPIRYHETSEKSDHYRGQRKPLQSRQSDEISNEGRYVERDHYREPQKFSRSRQSHDINDRDSDERKDFSGEQNKSSQDINSNESSHYEKPDGSSQSQESNEKQDTDRVEKSDYYREPKESYANKRGNEGKDRDFDERNNYYHKSKIPLSAKRDDRIDRNENNDYNNDQKKSSKSEESYENLDSDENKNDNREPKTIYTNSNDKSDFKNGNTKTVYSNSNDAKRLSDPYRKSSSEELESNANISNIGDPKYSKYSKTPLSSAEGVENFENHHDKSSEPRENFQRKHEDEAIQINNSSLPIRDVDLRDFSYERIEINDKGDVESARDNHDHLEINSPQDKTKHESVEADILSSLHTTQLPISEDLTNFNNPTIKENAGEIRPVVEISDEKVNSSEEKNEESLRLENLSTEDKSLETILGNSDRSAKIEATAPPTNDKNDNVKQDFERIPLDYKHEAKAKPNENIKKDTEAIDDKPVSKDTDENDGTIDALKPEIQYDENLHFKFDDVAVKLPEIKLPDDVLSYIYEEPKYLQKEKDKNESRDRYHDESTENDDDDENEDHGYQYGHRGYGSEKENNDYKNQKQEEAEDDEEENVDLYEKFVRERFGKRDSFEKRSEKLLQQPRIPENPELFKTISKILKKTEETSKQAEQSGDPNAGYLWTLEYGQNL